MSLTTARTMTGERMEAFVTPDGVPRMLAAFPSAKIGAQRITDVHPVIPRSSWKPFNRIRPAVTILNQGQRSSCVGNGSARTLAVARDMANLSFIELSASYIYMQINGGRDAGSDPADAADALSEVGTVPSSMCDEDHIFKNQVNFSALSKVAVRFAVSADDLYSCQTFDEVVTAALLGFPFWDTIRVGQGFNNLDSNGIPPLSRGQGNHCTMGGEALVRLPNGDWALPKANSWGVGWGLGGWFVQSEAHYDQQPQWQAIAIRVPRQDPLDPDNPPM